MNYTYLIEVENVITGEIVKTLNVTGQRKASKVANGIEINLDPKYIVTVTKQDQFNQ